MFVLNVIIFIMLCFSPISIKNVSGTSAKDRLTVPCGKCHACKTNLRTSWTFRLNKELRYAKSAHFVTLTYCDYYLPKDGKLVKKDLQDYIKRLWHDALYECYKDEKGRLNWRKTMRYFAVGEYGEYLRPHYHILLFNFPDEKRNEIEKKWTKNGKLIGWVSVGTVGGASIHYVTKDMMKTFGKKSKLKPFRVMSTRPAIGSQFTDKLMPNKARNDFTVNLNGYRLAMPRYYKDKIFSIKQKEKHAEEMVKFSAKQLDEYLEMCATKEIDNPFVYLEKTRQDAINIDEKKLKLRKL